MSGTLSSVTMFAALVAIAVAANWAEDDSVRPSSRAPSSVAVPLRHTEKLRGSLRADLRVLGAAPVRSGDVYVVRGIVRSEESLADVSFTWALPEGTELVEGDLRGKLARVSADEPGQLDIKLRRGPGDDVMVHLVVGASDGGRRFADSAQLDSSGVRARTQSRPLAPTGGVKKFE